MAPGTTDRPAGLTQGRPRVIVPARSRLGATSRHRTTAWSSWGILLLVVPACARVADEATVHHDVGRIPPGYSGRIEVVLPPLCRTNELLSVVSSCGCLDAKVEVDNHEIGDHGRVEANHPIHLFLRFEPNRQLDGPVAESLRLRFGSDGRVEAIRTVEIRGTVDNEMSLLAGRIPVELESRVPIGTLDIRIPLRRALAPSDVRFEGRGWVRLDDSKQSDTGTILHLVAGPVDTIGTLEETLRVRIGPALEQRVPVRLSATPPKGYGFVPSKVVVSLPRGGTVEHPVTLRGDRVELVPESVVVESEAAVRQREPATRDAALPASDAPALELVADPELSGEQLEAGTPLRLRLSKFPHPGLFRGQLLVRPWPAASFRLALPYSIRVY